MAQTGDAHAASFAQVFYALKRSPGEALGAELDGLTRIRRQGSAILVAKRGFGQLAIRHQVPVIPLACVGARTRAALGNARTSCVTGKGPAHILRVSCLQFARALPISGRNELAHPVL